MDKRVDYTITIKASYEVTRGNSKLPKRLIKEVLAYAKTRLNYKGPTSAICLGITADITEFTVHKNRAPCHYCGNAGKTFSQRKS